MLPAGDLSLVYGDISRTTVSITTPRPDAASDHKLRSKCISTWKQIGGGLRALSRDQEPEITAVLRYDLDQAYERWFGKRSVGEDLSATTHKISGRYQVVPQVLDVGSYGTGFMFPDMPSLAPRLCCRTVRPEAVSLSPFKDTTVPASPHRSRPGWQVAMP
jgi:hypothetical protein